MIETSRTPSPDKYAESVDTKDREGTPQNIWRLLNRVDPQPVPEGIFKSASTLAFSAVFDYFKETDKTRLVNLRALTAEDRSYLRGKKISLGFLRSNFRKTLFGRHLDPRAFQLTALKEKAIYAICPFTGARVSSHHSLPANINVFFYRFSGKEVFYLITAGIGSGFRKSAVYFPEHELVVTVGDAWNFEIEDLFELKARAVTRFKECYEYLSSDNPIGRKTAVCLGFFHFAHHLWNELSGIDRVYKGKLLESVDKIFLLREPLGDINQIFPELPSGKVERKSHMENMFREIIEGNYFAVRIGDDFVAKDLAERVYAVAVRQCSPTILEQVKQAGDRHFPLLWVGIRVGTRSWENQVEGLSKIIGSLHAEFPRLGVVFDGFSLPADKMAATGENEYSGIVAMENEAVDGIVARLRESGGRTPAIFNIIGGSIFEANVWAHAIDVYVSPHGTLQHKVGWLTNKPGIIHTNHELLECPPSYIWTKIEGARKPSYVRLNTVTHIRSADKQPVIYREISDFGESGAGNVAGVTRVQGNPEFDNYSVEWEPLYRDLLPLIRASRKRLAIPSPLVLLNGSMRGIKKTLQTLTNSFDRAKL
jgi:hypothetical protein